MKFSRRMVQGLVAMAMAATVVSPAFASAHIAELDDYVSGTGRFVEATAINGTMVTAARNNDDNLRVQAFYTNTSQDFVADSVKTYSTITDVDVTDVRDAFAVTALGANNGTLKLIAFDPHGGTGGRTLTRLGEIDFNTKNVPLSGSPSVQVSRIGPGTGGMLVTTGLTPDWRVRVDTWVVSSDGETFAWKDTAFSAAGTAFDQIHLAGDYSSSTRNFVIVARNADASKNAHVQLWTADSLGNLTLKDTDVRGGISNASVTLSGTRMFLGVAGLTGGGELQRWELVGGNDLVWKAEDGLPMLVNEVDVVDFGDSAMVVVQEKSGAATTDELLYVMFGSPNNTAVTYLDTMHPGTETQSVAAVKSSEDTFFTAYVYPDFPNNMYYTHMEFHP